ncbi:hypothetical protein [Paenibacillus beijingensis]|uniref:Uncharacterized protein n=1 Tax=Paenibacillus beijingensis TaxID=1126833 RepID=A0A0D5NGT3_9BACL|nr:hypothetical protein [Paenibacillus beijingensis]AJY74491.1 hypothetical protein VN24_07775 [Paenibacillus beijingensis]
MKRLHLALIVLLALLLTVSIGWGMVWLYAAKDTVPHVSADGSGSGWLREAKQSAAGPGMARSR